MSLIDSEDYDIRFSTLDDTHSLRSLLKLKGMLHWFPPGDDLELENFIRIWMGYCRYSSGLTATYQNEPIGMAILFLMPYRKVAHHAMFQLIVDPDYQRKGVGTSLAKNVKHLAKTRFQLDSIHVEILDDNPVCSLLEKLEFKRFARQERFVKEGDMYFPRILMECDLV